MQTIIGAKKGMTQIFTEDGTVVPVTIIDVSNVSVVAHLKSGDNVSHVVLGKDVNKNANKSEKGKYSEVPRFAKAVKVGADIPEIKSEQSLAGFAVGDKVKVSGITKGKGFQGVVKRWGFAGGTRTHGQSDRQRHPGSIGQRMTPGRVFKGLKMGGHMGVASKSVLNLKIMAIDTENKLVLVKGAVPGAVNSYVVINK